MQKRAILGGTFNPVHWGHLLIAETALSQFNLDRVIWVPAQHPPHKDSVLSYAHRYEMVQQAIVSHPGFALSSVAGDRTSSYAIETLRTLQSHAPNAQWFWILGLDAFCSLPRWVARRELAADCSWLIAPRFAQTAAQVSQPLTGSKRSLAQLSSSQLSSAVRSTTEQVCIDVADQLAAESIEIRWQILQMPIVEISSSLIRRYCREQRSIRYLVPESVRAYIATHALYDCPNADSMPSEPVADPSFLPQTENY